MRNTWCDHVTKKKIGERHIGQESKFKQKQK
jgi:hypothetical protein